jgi:SAM-dependent methyltransferase
MLVKNSTDIQGVMASDPTRQKLWTEEYDILKGIHLDYSDELPPAVSFLHDAIQQKQGRALYKTLLDIGCGKGRIGIHLARLGYQVIGIDFVTSALKEFEKIAESYHLRRQIVLMQQDLNERWKIDDLSIDVAVAITVIDNLPSPEQQHHFKHELTRVLRPHGLFVLEVYRQEDDYYGNLLQISPNKERGILVDPNNHIRFKIYSREEIFALFGKEFTVLREKDLASEGIKYGKQYTRKSKVVIFEKIL